MNNSKERLIKGSVWLLVVFTYLALSSLCWAQIDTGSISGTVKDPVGRVVPGVQLTLTNEATTVTQRAKSLSSGTYVFPVVPPGLYTLRAKANGFKTYVETHIQVQIQHTVTTDIQLELGAVRQQVTVRSAAPLLQAQSASVGQTVGSIHVNDLPLNGRNWTTLASVQAGNYSNAPAGGLFANGIENGQVDYRLNGIDDNGNVFGGYQVAPIPDAIQEFKLQQNNNSAEFGHSMGTVVNAVTKAGTNQFHGDLFEYNRNEAYDANGFFNNLHHVTKKPKYRQNQFGGMIGGPVIIPHVYNGKDKTFFFFDFQRTLISQAATFTRTIPTDLMRSSGFQNLQDLITGNSGTAKDALGRIFPHGTVFDPTTTRDLAPGATDPVTGLTNSTSNTITVRDPFYAGSLAGVTDFTGAANEALLNMIPSGRIDSNAVKLLMLLPAPTESNKLRNDYFVNVPRTVTENQYDIRGDQNFSPKDRLSSVFSRATNVQSDFRPFPGIAGGNTAIHSAVDYPEWLLSVSETHIFSPTLLNEARLGINHGVRNRIEDGANDLGIPAQYGIQGVPQFQYNGGLPTFQMSGFSDWGGRRYDPTIQTNGARELTDNLTWLHGKHEVKTGIQYDRIYGHILQPAYGKGNFVYNGQYSDIPNKRSNLVGIADMLLTPTTALYDSSYANLGGLSIYRGSNFATSMYNANYWGLYFQDNWRITPQFTANLGVRWDYFGPYNDTNGAEANFIEANGVGPGGAYFIAHDGCVAPRSSTFNALLASYNINVVCQPGNTVNQAQKTNFAPRVGFAYRVRPRLVVRGAYGISYGAFDNVGYGGTMGTNYPFQFTIQSAPTTSQLPITLTNGETATLENTFANVNTQSALGVDGQGLGLTGKQYNYQTPYTQSINFTVQDQFTNHDSIQVGYLGTLGRHLDTFNSQNIPYQILPVGSNVASYRPFANLSGGQLLATSATSNYHSLQAVYEHRFTNGLALAVNYTFAKCMSNDHGGQGKGALSNSNRNAEWLQGWGNASEYTLCPGDSAHVFHVYGEYALPFGHGERFMANANKLANAVIGGWQINYMFTHQSGYPVNIGCPVGTTGAFGCYALKVPGQDPYAGPHDYTQWLNPNAFAQPCQLGASGPEPGSPSGCVPLTGFGLLGGQANQVRGPGWSDLDASIFKNFQVTEHARLQLRLEAFNALNAVEFGNPGQLNFSNTKNFSNITGTRVGARIVQIAAKILF